ncbi:hypothetical protein MSPP1_000428 [Malassezia sp. CBS 17886]|nr:hypothetical protein MSPP1_000428 [Malassezia sp. CBS 17886]
MHLRWLAVFVLVRIAHVLAWGATGHEIVGTIAQALLHPLVRAHLCAILPPNTSYYSDWPASEQHCHLAPVAPWADVIKQREHWGSQLHYVNARNDTPPATCVFGETGFVQPERNLLVALANYTDRVQSSAGSERVDSLRYLVHFLGDLHQPLHVAARERGGNGVRVGFEGRSTTLHGVWDSALINRRIRSLTNYTAQLPRPSLESALRGRHYDAYIRWILVEGLGIGMRERRDAVWWEDWRSWTKCPTSPDTAGNITDPDTALLCPLYWGQKTHAVACQYAFAAPVPWPRSVQHVASERGLWRLAAVGTRALIHAGNAALAWVDAPAVADAMRSHLRGAPVRPPLQPLPDVSSAQYMGPIESAKIVERQLAQAGVRLAALVNALLLAEAGRRDEVPRAFALG